MTAVENSLIRLQTDYIDLYQVQRPDPGTDIEETLSALSDLVHSGKVRAIGVIHHAGIRNHRGPVGRRAPWPGAVPRRAAALLTAQPQHRGRGPARRPALRDGRTGVGATGPGTAHGRVRKGQQNELRRAGLFRHLNDERRLDVVEKLIDLAGEAGLPMTHLALGFAIAHPGVTSAIVGPRTMAHLDDLLAGLDVTLSDEILDRIDQIVPPGTDVGTLDQAYVPPPLQHPGLRRRPVNGRAAA